MTRTRQRRDRIARNRKRRRVLWVSTRWGVKRDHVRAVARLDPTLFDPPRIRWPAPSFIGFDCGFPDYTYQVPIRAPLPRPSYWLSSAW